jgi:7-cyano-7-deazaguanine synthase
MLASGGPDCIVAAALLQDQGYRVTLLHFQYGQKAECRELHSVTRCAKEMDLCYSVRYFTGVFAVQGSGILAGNKAGKEELKGQTAFLPARNLILLSIAAGIAEAESFSYLAIGNIADGAYPDNKLAFREAFDAVLPHALSKGVTVRCLAPVNQYTKAEVIKIGSKLGVPFEHTWSCYEGADRHCGACASCVKRRKAFSDNNLVDPVPYSV